MPFLRAVKIKKYAKEPQDKERKESSSSVNIL
jgi:hypothetical protein